MKSYEQLPEQARALLNSVKQIVHRFIPTASILLYGSAARGTHNPESDYDVLILTDRPLSTKEEDIIIDAVYDLELENGVVVSLVFYTQEEWDNPHYVLLPFHQNVEKDAILV